MYPLHAINALTLETQVGSHWEKGAATQGKPSGHPEAASQGATFLGGRFTVQSQLQAYKFADLDFPTGAISPTKLTKTKA